MKTTRLLLVIMFAVAGLAYGQGEKLNCKLIKLTEDGLTSGQFRPVAGHEKMIGVKVVDEAGNGIFGAEVEFSVNETGFGMVVVSTAEAPSGNLKLITGVTGDALVFLLTPEGGSKRCLATAVLAGQPNTKVVWEVKSVGVPSGIEKNHWHKFIEKTKFKNKPFKKQITIAKDNDGKIEQKVAYINAQKQNSAGQEDEKNQRAYNFWYMPQYDSDLIAFNKSSRTAIFRICGHGTLYPYRLVFVQAGSGKILKEERYRRYGNGIVHKFITEYSEYNAGVNRIEKTDKAFSGLNSERYTKTTILSE